MKFCTNCGARLPDETKFCSECGQRVEVIAPEVPQEPVAAAQSYVSPVQESDTPPVQQSYAPPVQESYTPPVQQTYEAPVRQSARTDDAGSYTPPPRQGSGQPQPGFSFGAGGGQSGKSGSKKGLVIGGIAAAAVLVIVLLVVFLGGGKGGKEDPNLGRYDAVSCTVLGIELGAEGDWLELKADGKASMRMFDDEFICTWKLEGEALTLTQQGDEFTGTLKDGVIVMDYGDMIVTYEKSDAAGSPAVTPKETRATETEPQEAGLYDWWQGDWYGWWVIWEGEGEFAEWTDFCWDTCARIRVSGDTGTITIWDSDGSETDPMAECRVSFGPGTTEHGCMMSESGSFFDAEVGHADWIVDPGASVVTEFDSMIAIDGTYVDPENENNTVEYYIILRPWGMDWEDVRNTAATGGLYQDMMPPDYDTWYQPLLKAGAAMPSGFATAPSGGGTTAYNGTSVSWSECDLTVVGAEHFIDTKGKDGIRVYYDFTNTSDETTSAYSLLEFEVTQDGYELMSTYVGYEEDVPEYGNDGLLLRPGATIRCILEYNMKQNGGPISVTLYNFWDEDETLTVEFDSQDLPGRPGDFTYTPVTNPQWTAQWSDEGVYRENYYLFIDSAEIVEGTEGEQLIRVYYEFANNSDETTSLWLISSICVFQDGVELEEGYPAAYVAEDDNYYEEIEPGATIRASQCYVLRSGNPVEVEASGYWGEDSIACVFELS